MIHRDNSPGFCLKNASFPTLPTIADTCRPMYFNTNTSDLINLNMWIHENWHCSTIIIVFSFIVMIFAFGSQNSFQTFVDWVMQHIHESWIIVIILVFYFIVKSLVFEFWESISFLSWTCYRDIRYCLLLKLNDEPLRMVTKLKAHDYAMNEFLKKWREPIRVANHLEFDKEHDHRLKALGKFICKKRRFCEFYECHFADPDSPCYVSEEILDGIGGHLLKKCTLEMLASDVEHVKHHKMIIEKRLREIYDLDISDLCDEIDGNDEFPDSALKNRVSEMIAQCYARDDKQQNFQ